MRKENDGDIHYHVYFPDSYDGKADHALFITDASYFAGTGIAYQHGGGYLFCRDKKIMGWLFGK